jgi:SAM-dependent methyltransferase
MTIPAPTGAPDAVAWHDLECGGYVADLPLWRELAAAAGGPVLDVGAGTGRVALDLARAGHEVVALDVDGRPLAALRARAAGLPVRTVEADARSFSLARRFGLVLAPMQTVQLLGGAAGRASFLACAREHLAPAGLVAIAIADGLEAASPDPDSLPLPDMVERDGWVLASQPLALRYEDGGFAIERERQAVAPDGTRTSERDVVRLDAVTVDELESEGEAAGFAVEPARRIAETIEHVGSWVVMLRG